VPDPEDHPALVLRDDAERLRHNAVAHDADGQTDAAALARAKAAACEKAVEQLEAFARGKWFRLR
jgi:hypothetical protein